MEPADDKDKPVFVGRFNIGVVSLHLPMILAKSREEGKDFYEVLDYYLEMIRSIHKRTYEYLGGLRASINPIQFCEGGVLGGHLKPNDTIAPLLKPMTASFGITALNELQQLYNQKSLVQDGQFALDVLKYINKKVEEFKHEDGWLYAIYGTPGESLCLAGDTQVQAYVDGKQMIKQISDIKRGDLVYSYNINEHKIELKPVIESTMTSPSAKVMKIEFTNGQSVICTPNHPFAKRTMIMKTNGIGFEAEVVQYTEAQYLKPGNRIKSNYVVLDIGKHLICTTDQYIHRINAEYKLGKIPDGYVVHHINEDKLDNSFDNLAYMTGKDHRREHIPGTIQRFQYRSNDVIGPRNPFYARKHRPETNEINRQAHLGQNNALSKAVIQMTMDGKIVAKYESRGIAEATTGFKNISYACNGLYSSKSEPHEYNGYLWFYTKDIQPLNNANHVVKSVAWLDEPIPVYNIEVADNNNFYVGGMSGILVHNCHLQVQQFREKYGIIENVSDREYVSNSFHCHVSEDISPIVKQNLEGRFWDCCNGGKIQYCRYPVKYNIDAVRTLVNRAMKLGYYEGVNLELSYCDDCGYQQLEITGNCPQCGSSNIISISRMNG